MPRDLAIDLGSASIQVIDREAGLLMDEPSVIAVDDTTGSVVAVGDDARALVGHAPGAVRIQHPVQRGTITDYAVAAKLVGAVLRRLGARRAARPRVLMVCSAAATSVERRALIDVASEAGAAKVELIEQPLAAAIGVDLAIQEPTGSVVVSMGAGTTEAALISLGGIVSKVVSRTGGDDVNHALATALRLGASVAIGERAAEEVKRALPSLLEDPARSLDVVGRDATAGEPASVLLHGDQVEAAIAEVRRTMVETVTRALAAAPPELAQDAIDGGIHLVGGGSLLTGLAEQVAAAADVPAVTYPDPHRLAAQGAGRCLGAMSSLRVIFS